ncbi:MAG: HAMP domain-containing histidine kinase [Betaproteobacteria bacterium]|nr:HAMP domain-containing histidine kinase [Betaproteobacteria bacterium]
MASASPMPPGAPRQAKLWKRLWIALILALLVQALVSALVFHWVFEMDPQRAQFRREVFRAFMQQHGIGPPSPWRHLLMSPFFGTVVTAILLSLVTYPIMRRLTRRLENLQQGVRAWGGGDLSARVPVQGRDEVAQLAQSFNTAAGRIESLMQSHKSLLAYTSHELRTPLTRLRLSLETLSTPVPAAARDVAARAAKHDLAELDALIDDILLSSRLDAATGQTLQLEELDLLALLAEEAARFDVEVHGDWITLQGDERLLRRAVRNLLDNAQRHAPGAAPQVSLTAVRGGGIIRVCDQGPGIPPADAQRIFEPFERLSGRGEGTGLGLALVRRIARQHGGDARCLPRAGGGTCFEIWLGRKP